MEAEDPEEIKFVVYGLWLKVGDRETLPRNYKPETINFLNFIIHQKKGGIHDIRIFMDASGLFRLTGKLSLNIWSRIDGAAISLAADGFFILHLPHFDKLLPASKVVLHIP